MSTPFLIYLYRTSLGECTVLGISLGITYQLHLSTYIERFWVLSASVCIGSGACLYVPLLSFYAFALYMYSLYLFT
ncbi:hypothetical protein BRC2024_KVFYQCYK_CDS_0033 [Acinetobacter phage vB_AbaP_Fishpie]